jgi:hypothetical protein
MLLNNHGDMLLTNSRQHIDHSSSAGSGETSLKDRKQHTSILGEMHRGDRMEFEAANNSTGSISNPFTLSFSNIAEEELAGQRAW